MISFRYHIFTIVAIFLAIGLGLLVGNIYVQPGLVNHLRSQTESLRAELADREAQVGDLNSQVGELQRAGDILPELDRGGLVGVPVVIVTQDGVEGQMLAQARASLDAARADLVAVLSVTDRMTASDGPSRQALAQVAGLPSDAAPTDLQKAVAMLLAERLANGAPELAGASPQSDPLDELLRGQFLRFPPGLPKVSEAALAQLGGKSLVVVALDGGTGEPFLQPADFMIPFVKDLVRSGANVAAGESASTDYPFVVPLRTDGPADGTQMVTVDDIDFSAGGAALVLGLERLLSLGEGGNYGIKGDVRPIPPLT